MEEKHQVDENTDRLNERAQGQDYSCYKDR